MERKLALVTGGAVGIGAAISRALAEKGYQTGILYHHSAKQAHLLCDTLQAQGHACFCEHTDVTDEAEVRMVFADVFQQYGPPAVLINNAGIAQSGLLTDYSCAEWMHLFHVNFDGVLHTTHAVYPAMVRQKSGIIINIASIWGESGASCEAVYAASKGAVIAFSRSLASELGPSGIRVCCICPGVIDTQMLQEYTNAEKQALADATPLGRLGTPQDVAQAVLYLCDAPFLTGTVLRIDGGFLLGNT